MKTYEKESLDCVKIDHDQGFFIRLDGHTFSTFTKSVFRKPFDPIFVVAMYRTLCDLMMEFRPATGYCHSDEISLYFPPMTPKDDGTIPERDRGGKVFKLLTHTAAFCSVRFNYHLNDIVKDPEVAKCLTDKALKIISENSQYFDSRIMLVPKTKPYDVMNYFMFRSNLDCRRNCVSTYHRYLYGHKLTMHKNTLELLKRLDKIGFSEEVPMYLLYGIYLKFEHYTKMEYVEHYKKEIEIIRKRLSPFMMKMSCGDDQLELLTKPSVEEDTYKFYESIGVTPLDPSSIDLTKVIMEKSS